MVVITPTLAMQLIGFTTKATALALEKSNPKVAENLALLSQLVDAGAQTAKAFKSPSIGDVTKKDPLSFNEALTINKDGALSGIDYEKFNFDKALSDKGMKAFSTDIKNSDTIFSFNEGLKIGDISEIDYGKNNFDEYPNYFN